MSDYRKQVLQGFLDMIERESTKTRLSHVDGILALVILNGLLKLLMEEENAS